MCSRLNSLAEDGYLIFATWGSMYIATVIAPLVKVPCHAVINTILGRSVPVTGEHGAPGSFLVDYFHDRVAHPARIAPHRRAFDSEIKIEFALDRLVDGNLS